MKCVKCGERANFLYEGNSYCEEHYLHRIIMEMIEAKLKREITHFVSLVERHGIEEAQRKIDNNFLLE